MVAPEPAHLVGLVKACPLLGCRSPNVKWRYYNNRKRSQPRYECLACKEYFTFGGKIRLAKEEKKAALREKEASVAAVVAVKKKGPRIKITPAKSPSNLRAVKELQLMMELCLEKNKISRPNDLSMQSASSISKPKRMQGGAILLRLNTGTVISLPDSSLDEKYQVDGDASTNSQAEFEELFVGCEDMAVEFVELFGGSEHHVALEPKLEHVDNGGARSGACSPNDQLKSLEDPAFSWTSSEQLLDPVVRCGGPSESELVHGLGREVAVD